MAGDPELEFENSAPLDQQEDLDDLNLPKDWYFGASLWSTDWTAETIVSQLKRGNINLSPKYQRRKAWDEKRQSRFIKSLILGLPVPQIILAEDKARRGSFIVIDGKQRLLSLRQFTAEKGDEFTPLYLSGLDDRKDLNGTTYIDLKTRPEFRDDLNSFENQSIRTIVIRNWKDDRYLHSVFLRINTGSVQLSPQELRQALHPGKFADFIDDFSVKSEALQEALKISEPDFRMRDAELVLRYYAYFYRVRAYTGDLKKFLDDTVDFYNVHWDQAEAGLKAMGETFDTSLQAIRVVFGERDELRKWNGQIYEKRINRAVFDIMMYYISNEALRKDFVRKGKRIKAAFQTLCENDQEFLSSVETTTKSIGANQIRFRRWGEALQKITGRRVISPL